MKKCFLLFSAILLCGCNLTNTKIECSYVTTSSNGGTSYFYYGVSRSNVYEFKSQDGKLIYSNNGNSNLNVYQDYFDVHPVEYTCVGIIGYVIIENRVFLDLNNNTIETKTQIKEYKTTSSSPYADRQLDHAKALKCTKSYKYLINPSNETATTGYGGVILNSRSSGLTRNFYTKYGEDTVIYYIKK